MESKVNLREVQKRRLRPLPFIFIREKIISIYENQKYIFKEVLLCLKNGIKLKD